MKRNRSKTMLAFVAGAALMAALPTTVHAQAIAQKVAQADVAARTQNWEAAYPLYKECTSMYEPARLVKLFGAKSAAYLWYRRGQCAQTLAKKAARGADKAALEAAKPLFDDAIKSYMTCHKLGASTMENPNKNKVIYHVGQVKQALMDYEGALQSYGKFKASYNRRVKGELFFMEGKGKGKFMLDKTMCYLKQKAPNIDQGKKGLSWVMQPEVKNLYQIPDAAIVGGFLALCEAIKVEVTKVKKDVDKRDELERDLIKFMSQSRGMITLQPYQMYAYTPYFLKLVVEQQKLGMHKASFALQSFLPNTTLSKESMELKIHALGGEKAMQDYYDTVIGENIARDLINLKQQEDKGEPHEMTQNLLLAAYYEKEGNSRAAFAIYEMIELYHSDHPKREEWLFQLVRTSYNIGEIFKTTNYGQLFLKDFPKSDKVPEVEKFMLTTLFQNGKYNECITIANKLMPTLAPGTKQHDIASYCLGGSYYYLGQPLKAGPVLDAHVKLYGKGTKAPSDFAMATQYWDGSNDTYLQNWSSAAGKLDKFLADYPKPSENPYYPLAKYDRANCHTNLEEDALSIPHLDIVCANHKDCPIIDRAYALRGNNHQNIEKFDEAYADYLEALNLARRAKNITVEEEVLNYLVLLLGDDKQKDAEKKKANFLIAVKYYDEFWALYSKGAYNAQVAVTGIPALRGSSRGKEALQNLKQVIVQIASQANAPGMDKAINSYTEEYLKEKGNTPVMLEKHYANDFSFTTDMVYARSLVKMSLVDTYLILAAAADKAKDKANAEKWRLAVKGQLAELARFDLSKLNNFALVTIGDNIRVNAETTAAFAGATTFYEQVIENSKSNKDHSYKNESIFGLASVLAETKDAAKMQKAYATLSTLKDHPKSDKKTREKAHYNMVKLAYGMDNFADAITNGVSFKDTYPSSKYKVQVRQALAESYYMSGNKDKASTEYQSILIAYTGVIKYSGPAILKVMEITSGKGDKYKAYIAGESYVKMCNKSFTSAIKSGKMSGREADLWEKVKNEVRGMENDVDVVRGMEEEKLKKAARDNVEG